MVTIFTALSNGISKKTITAAFLVSLLLADLKPNMTLAQAEGAGVAARQTVQVIHIGVQSTEGTTRALESWKPIIEVLNSAAIEQELLFEFTVQPYATDEIRLKIKAEQVDVVFVDPATYVWAEVKKFVRPLLSSATMWDGEAIEQNGAVIFTRSDRTEIRRIADLKGRKLMAVEADSFEGWQLAHNEILLRKFEPSELLSSILYSNGNQRDVVYAVQNGLVDAGVVRSGVLEGLAEDSIIDMAAYAVVSSQTEGDYPFLSSTSPQPGWALAALPNVSEGALTVIVETLLRVGTDNPTADSAGNIVWQAPQNYQSVHNMLIYLRAAPYENYFRQAVLRIFNTYQSPIILGFFTILMSLGFLAYQVRRNVQLIEEGRDVLASEVRSKRFYRNAVEEHTVFCMLNMEGEISHVNRQFCEVTDYKRADLLKRTLASLLSEDQKNQLNKEIADTLKSGVPWKGTLRLNKPDGTQAWTQCTIIPVSKSDNKVSELALVASDVTQTCSGISKESFHNSLELISDQVIVLRPRNFEILHCNQAAVERFIPKIHNREWRNKKLDEFVDQTEFRSFEMRRDALIEGPQRRITWESDIKNRSPYEVSLEYIQPENEEPRLVVIYRDISEKRAAEKAKNEFVSTISHELRTPLTSMKGALGLVLSGKIGETSGQVGKLVEMADSNCNRLVMLINDILDLEKIDAGKMEYSMSTVDLVDLVTSSVESNQFYADKFDVKLVTVIGDDPDGYFVTADFNRMVQVMDNLLSNAAKFSDKDSEIIVSLAIFDECVRLSIRDFGSGIPKNSQPTIFDKFVQGDSSDTRSKGGTGLGLAIVKTIVEVHKGTINFDSEEGVGTEFFVDLPRLIDGQEVSTPVRAAVESSNKQHVLPESNIANDAHSNLLDHIQSLIAKMGENQIVSKLKSDDVTARQIVNGLGMFGRTNILSWISRETRSIVTDLITNKSLVDTDVIAISSTAQRGIEDDGRSLLAIEAAAVTTWLSEITNDTRTPLRIVGIGDNVEFDSGKNTYVHVDTIEQCVALVSEKNCDVILSFSTINNGSKLAVTPISDQRLGNLIPIILMETRIEEGSFDRGVVATFAHPSSAGRGKDRRRKASY